ncbi:MAG: DNA cytosine methyltransferase, partial [Nitrospira sp.]|nr:DNA cytosine methyltransferase [Nitrospira sp.]
SHPKGESRPITLRDAWRDCQVGEVGKLSPGLASIIPRIPIWGDGGDVTGKNSFSTKRLDYNKPSRTIFKDATGTRSALIHPSEDRPIGIGEAKRIGSFPDDYQFVGGYKDIIPRIGNSVPPLMIKSIARHIRQEILDKIRDPIRLSK